METHGPPRRRKTHPTFSDAADRVIRAADREKNKFGHHYIGTEHLLLAVARSPDPGSQLALERAGISTDSITEKVNDILKPTHRILDRWSGIDLESIWNSSLAYRDREQATELVSKRVTHPGEEMSVNPIFHGRKITGQANRCFALMPFKPTFDRVMNSINKAAISAKLKAIRADGIFGPEPIMEQIWSEINKARLIVADVTHKNPNVFYELGIAHTVGKPVIIITQRAADAPFDLRHLRFLRYKADSQGLARLTKDLKKAMRSVLDQARR